MAAHRTAERLVVLPAVQALVVLQAQVALAPAVPEPAADRSDLNEYGRPSLSRDGLFIRSEVAQQLI
jgi:hypothetical protein